MKSPKKILRTLLHVCKVHRIGLDLELGELRKLEIARERREKFVLFLQLCIVLLLLQFHILRKIFLHFHRSSKLVINLLASIITSRPHTNITDEKLQRKNRTPGSILNGTP
jgi:hypothetical protein